MPKTIPASQRRVERRRDAGGGAGQHEAALAVRRQPPEREHDRGADLHRRPLAPAQGAAKQTERQHHDLAEGDAHRNKRAAERIVLTLTRGDHLRNAAAFRAFENFSRQQRGDGKPRRCDDQRRVGPGREELTEQTLRDIGEQRDQHRGRRVLEKVGDEGIGGPLALTEPQPSGERHFVRYDTNE